MPVKVENPEGVVFWVRVSAIVVGEKDLSQSVSRVSLLRTTEIIRSCHVGGFL